MLAGLWDSIQLLEQGRRARQVGGLHGVLEAVPRLLVRAGVPGDAHQGQPAFVQLIPPHDVVPWSLQAPELCVRSSGGPWVAESADEVGRERFKGNFLPRWVGGRQPPIGQIRHLQPHHRGPADLGDLVLREGPH